MTASKKKAPAKKADPLRLDVDSKVGHTVVITVYTMDQSNVTNGQLGRALRQALELLLEDGGDDGKN